MAWLAGASAYLHHKAAAQDGNRQDPTAHDGGALYQGPRAEGRSRQGYSRQDPCPTPPLQTVEAPKYSVPAETIVSRLLKVMMKDARCCKSSVLDSHCSLGLELPQIVFASCHMHELLKQLQLWAVYQSYNNIFPGLARGLQSLLWCTTCVTTELLVWQS